MSYSALFLRHPVCILHLEHINSHSLRSKHRTCHRTQVSVAAVSQSREPVPTRTILGEALPLERSGRKSWRNGSRSCARSAASWEAKGSFGSRMLGARVAGGERCGWRRWCVLGAGGRRSPANAQCSRGGWRGPWSQTVGVRAPAPLPTRL